MSLTDKVTQFAADADITHQIVHGGAATTVATNGGPVRSLAKLIADSASYIADIAGFKFEAETYTQLRAYTGGLRTAHVLAAGIAGTFIRSLTDTTSADNGGTVIVDGAGRRWLRVYTGPVSVQWFGAVGDGAASDTAAIQAALNSGASVIIFPAGTYLVTALTLASACVLSGAGKLKRSVVAGSAILEITASNVVVDGLKFAGVYEGATPTATNNSERAIYVHGASTPTQISNITVRGCSIDGMAGNGIDIRYVTNVLVTENNVKNCGYAGIIGLSLQHAVIRGNRVDNINSGAGLGNWYGIGLTRDPSQTTANSARSSNCIIANNVISGVAQWTGIDLHAGYKCSISGNHVYYCKHGIYAQYDSSTEAFPQPSEEIAIIGNTVEGRPTVGENAIGIASLGLSAAMPNSGIVIADNITIGCGHGAGSAIGAYHIDRTNHAEVKNNIAEKSIQTAVSLVGACSYVVISGNKFNGCKAGTSNPYWMYADTANLTACLIERNVFVNTTGNASYTANYGILYTATTTQLKLARNRIYSLVGSAYVQKSGGSANIYTDLVWDVESETIKFDYTTTGGAAFEAVGNKSASFRRLPNITGTPILYYAVAITEPVTGVQLYGVRGSFGSIYTPAVFRHDAANVAAGVVINGITFTLTGVYWVD